MTSLGTPGVDDLFGGIGRGDTTATVRAKELRFLSMEESKESGTSNFSNMLDQALGAVSGSQDEVDAKLAGTVTGKPGEVHDVLIAMGKSEIAFNMLLQVRNHLIDAWRTITQIPI